MHTNWIITLILLVNSLNGFTQRYMPEFNNSDSQSLFEKAEKAYVNGNHERSIRLYDQLMKVEGLNSELLFNQLSSLIYSTDTIKIESTFKKLTEIGFLDCYYLASNKDFKSIKYRKLFKMWQVALQDCTHREATYIETNQIKYPEIRKQLLWMRMQDVTSDVNLTHKIKYDGLKDASYDQLKVERSKIYVNNFMLLSSFIEQLGAWPGKSLVGEDGAEAAWLITQHASHLPVQQEKFLALLKTAADNEEATTVQYAYLYDRVAANFKRPQRYGTLRWKNPKTEIWEIYPLEDETKVKEYRVEVGLPPLRKSNTDSKKKK